MMQKLGISELAMLLIYGLAMGAAQIVLSRASSEIADNSVNTNILYASISSIWLWVGVIVYVVSFAFWLYIIYKIDIRVAYPVAMSSVFFAALFQSIAKQQFPGMGYWVGLLLVLLGVVIINNSTK